VHSPDSPEDESMRLRALRALNILDTPAEERFDRLTRIAQRLFNVPISLVSLVDGHRQWFKSKQGLDAQETPRNISFCGHALLGDGIFMIPDATQDERFHDNPLVTGGPEIRFYAGCPLHSLDGSKLGTLCIIDREPRVLSDSDLQLLADLAHLVESELVAVELATLDELTAIANRRGFAMLAQHTLDYCELKSYNATLVFFDLNKFKAINDSYGHAAGDRVLVTFAEMLKSQTRGSDVLARLGGDEFVALLPKTSAEQAKQMITGFRERVTTKNRELNERYGYKISFACGIVEFDPLNHAGIDDLLAESDTLMYTRKRRRHSESLA
jgi:diguanylate cyclase (GGDEF)-like protein